MTDFLFYYEVNEMNDLSNNESYADAILAFSIIGAVLVAIHIFIKFTAGRDNADIGLFGVNILFEDFPQMIIVLMIIVLNKDLVILQCFHFGVHMGH